MSSQAQMQMQRSAMLGWRRQTVTLGAAAPSVKANAVHGSSHARHGLLMSDVLKGKMGYGWIKPLFSSPTTQAVGIVVSCRVLHTSSARSLSFALDDLFINTETLLFHHP
ncbi:hypothetical protein Hypma_010578 [Hypsizygus marmoreus]|uniref:Uncharacterized protein n=1 Tax=Hypsizygus marmoreus TaxID=39966 RepID=A0A369JM61_HYPMA|nr:hypothetical protein Hypma_010578 [Hypsizygus marmoreus]